jgi:hypothetical protein
MAFANLSRDGVAVLMPDRNRLVMTVTAHYEKFPLSDVYVKAFQILRVVARWGWPSAPMQQQLHALRMAPPDQLSPITPRILLSRHTPYQIEFKQRVRCVACCLRLRRYAPAFQWFDWIEQRGGGGGLGVSEQMEPKLVLFSKADMRPVLPELAGRVHHMFSRSISDCESPVAS